MQWSVERKATADEQLEVFIKEQDRTHMPRAYSFIAEAFDFIRTAPEAEARKMLSHYGRMMDGDYGYGQWDYPGRN